MERAVLVVNDRNKALLWPDPLRLVTVRNELEAFVPTRLLLLEPLLGDVD